MSDPNFSSNALPLIAYPLPLPSFLLVLTATPVSIIVLLQFGSSYIHSYLTSTHELQTFLDAIEDSIQENESYDRDIARVGKLDDRLRLGRLLSEIRKCGDELRMEIDGLVVNAEERNMTLKGKMKLLWVWKRRSLRDRLRRMDMLRMRFLVAYMGIVAGIPNPPPLMPPQKQKEKEKPEGLGIISTPPRAPRHSLPMALGEPLTPATPPFRRTTSSTMGHNERTGRPQRAGWMGVVDELQNSPVMHKRRASVEQSSGASWSPRTPRSPRSVI